MPNEMDEKASMFPANTELVPSVAELPICQKTLDGLGVVDKEHATAGCGSECARNLENKLGIGVALSVERERPCYPQGRAGCVDSSKENLAAQISGLGGRGCRSRRRVVGRGQLVLSLRRECIRRMNRPGYHPWPARSDTDESGDGCTRTDTQIPNNHRGATVGHRGTGQNPERVDRRSQGYLSLQAKRKHYPEEEYG